MHYGMVRHIRPMLQIMTTNENKILFGRRQQTTFARQYTRSRPVTIRSIRHNSNVVKYLSYRRTPLGNTGCCLKKM